MNQKSIPRLHEHLKLCTLTALNTSKIESRMFIFSFRLFLIASGLLVQADIFLRLEGELASMLTVDVVERGGVELGETASELVTQTGALGDRFNGSVVLESRRPRVLVNRQSSEVNFAGACYNLHKYYRANLNAWILNTKILFVECLCPS